MAKDDLSDLSSLSSLSPPPPSESESEAPGGKKGILKFFSKTPKDKMTTASKEPSPPPRKRDPSPPHEYTFADNPDIAFIVMFRNRFDEAFSRSAPSFGPQELEYDITEPVPGSRAEAFLCAILGLLLNRKQDVKSGHYNRALEEAISSNKNQWPEQWKGKNPIGGSGGATFASMAPTERLTLLRTLIYWALSSSEAVRSIIAKSYKQARHEDDLNQPLSVQPWGSDSDKRRYFLVEGRDNTNFRVYRESNPAGFKRTWWSVADGIDSLIALADKLQTEDGGPKAKRLSQGIHQAIPRLQDSEEKRRRREYRQRTKERFKRPEIGFSLYEGRTRGKRVKYTYSDDEDDVFGDSGLRRSTRNTGTSTPADPTSQVTTMSGRQVRPPTRLNPDGESTSGSVQGDVSDTNSKQGDLVGSNGRARRAAARNHSANGWADRSGDSMEEDDEDDEASEADYGGDEGDGDHVPDESNDDDDDDDLVEEELLKEDLDVQDDKSFVVKLAVDSSRLKGLAPGGLPSPVNDSKDAGVSLDLHMKDAPVEGEALDIPRQLTPEPTVKADSEENGSRTTTAGITATSLAFRGSPEKSHIDAHAPSVDARQ
ncbi:uncharacterized protein DNG_05519 [Cephalotrichum gorgonifer]|uniref:WHIM1 domain-containing protein n=1 Tax=Cephalotrichum gorgonifer TaxID=2041049 RepID=A0AAE8N0N8_9PEZI|nr:uncharacterized protein DNG_05519 [Cephalotrichum gorgonifer]